MTDVAAVLRATRTVLLVDWPSRDVPDTLARGGFTVVSNDGPNEYNAYDVVGDEVRPRAVADLPTHADLVFSHRPIDELTGIVDTAKSVGAKAVWIQSGRDASGAKDTRGCWLSPADSKRARAIVEGAGLRHIESPYIAEAVRAR